MDLQHVNVKLLLANPAQFDLELLIPIFHRWIQGRIFEELLLDIADYRHVPNGPGIVLIGHQADYSVDNTGGRLGVRYNRKAPLDGTNQDRLKQGARAALTACGRLESEETLNGNLRFNGHEIEFLVNDRMLAPNNEATRQTVEPELRAFCRKLFGGDSYTLSFDTDPRRLLSAWVSSSTAFESKELLARITE